MATRRSRIKAVANLPARRSRPATSVDVKKEANESVEANGESSGLTLSEPGSSPHIDHQNEKNICETLIQQNIQSNTGDASQHKVLDRKSVIVTAGEKDRKSVIVNRDDGDTNAKKKSAENLTPCESDSVTASDKDDASHGSQQAIESNADVAPSKSSHNEDCTTPSTNKTGVSLNKRIAVGGRRSKPTVNLLAATRKRAANDTTSVSPCSPPPSKLRCSELFQRKASESENETISSGKTNDSSPHTESLDHNKPTPSKSNDQTSVALTPKSPLPAPASSAQSSKVSLNTSGPSKVCVSPQTKSADSSSGISNDNSCPLKESNTARRKQSSSALRVAAARKSLKSRCTSEGTPPRSALTMFDLIFYNPSKNPMKSSDSSVSKPRRRLASVSSISSIHEDRLNEESIDDVDDETGKEDTAETAMPVPRVKVGPDGSLILDEQSLVIETTGAKKDREVLEKSEVIVDTGSSYGHYKKTVRSKDWSDHETKKFYRALNVVGTDFSLMKPYFKNRSRRELKLKFKKEERLSPNLINKALAQPLDFDITELEKECALEDEEEKRQQELAKEKAKERIEDMEDVKVKKPAVRKKTVKRSVALAEMEEDLRSSSSEMKKKHTPRGKVKKTKETANAEADYNSLAQGVVLSETEKQSKQRKPRKKKAEDSPTKPRERKQISKKPLTSQPGEENSAVPKTVNKVRRKAPASQLASTSQANATHPVVIFEGSSNIPKILQSPTTPSVLQTGGKPGCGLKTPASATRHISNPTLKIVTSTTPLSQIRTVQASPQITPPLSSFGVSTPVSRLLPSTPSLPKMEPGSIIVLKTPLPQNPERHILQVYMVTNTPPGNSSGSVPRSPIVPGISLLQGPSAQPAAPKLPMSSDESDVDKELTKL